MKKYFYLIGGSRKYGSGKVLNHLKKYFGLRLQNFYFIETQKSRLGIFISLLNIPKNSKILFQPSICFPAFIRDLIIIIFLRLKTKNIKFILLVDICYKNQLMKNRVFRNIFFRNSKTITISSLSRNIKNQIRVTLK